jgi:hypothetical protein
MFGLAQEAGDANHAYLAWLSRPCSDGKLVSRDIFGYTLRGLTGVLEHEQSFIFIII